ncbi:hypothetical protein TWF694_003934 [Orbilia ellipsospora]|uniref:Nucleolar 27S pre-rRNA processing Urb2/Npa2 C-terminal domain-containing protein n=1 Tax=Orbilia ellipsospora TaxID=2528407 RepID=A0AAV9WWI2_9PEZI
MVPSTVTLTKSLRDKSKPLLDLIPAANSLYRGNSAVFFPRKEEWLVEWLVERLREEASPDARLSLAIWNTLYDLLKRPNLDLDATSSILRKHKFVDILIKTLSEASARFYGSNSDGINVSSNDGTDDVDMQDIASSTSSSGTELGSPLVRTAFFTGNHSRERRDLIRRAKQVQLLLGSIFDVVRLLKSWPDKISSRDAENPKRRKLNTMTPIFKSSPELAALLCESFFQLLYNLVSRSSWVEEASSWTSLCHLVWKASSYGISDTTKLASLVSEKLLVPIAAILTLQTIPGEIEATASWFLETYIFQPVSSPEKRLEFLEMLKPLKDACFKRKNQSLPAPLTLSLPTIFELAIAKADRDYSLRQRKQTDGFVSTLLSWMLSITNTQSSAQNRLLEIAIYNKVTPESSSLLASINLALNTTPSVDWVLLRTIAQVNLDAILLDAEDRVFSNLSNFDIRSDGEAVWLFVDQVITTSVESRDLENFLGKWFGFLSRPDQQSFDIWRSDRFQSLISSKVETGLTHNQIHLVVNKYLEAEKVETSLSIIDSILRGITRIETINRLGSDGIPNMLFTTLTTQILRDERASQWQCIRVLTRLLDIWPTHDYSDYIDETKRQLIRRTNTLLRMSRTLDPDASKELTLLLAILFVLQEQSLVLIDELQPIFRGFMSILMDSEMMRDGNDWDGSFDTISCASNAIGSFAITLARRFIATFAKFDERLQQEFLTQFLKSTSSVGASNSTATLRDAWHFFFQDGSNVYENIKTKDSIFVVMLAALKEESILQQQLPLILDVLNRCPLNALKKHQRDSLIDTLFLIVKKSRDQSLSLNILDILTRLARLSTNSTSLVSSVGSREGLYEFLILSGEIPDATIDKRINIVKLVFEYLTKSQHQEKAETRLNMALDLALEVLGNSKDSSIYPRAWSYCIVQGVDISKGHHSLETKARQLRRMLLTRLIEVTTKQVDRLNIDINFRQASLDLKFLESVVAQEKLSLEETGIQCKDVEQWKISFEDFLEKVDMDGSESVTQRLLYSAQLISILTSENGRQVTDIALSLANKGFYEQFRNGFLVAISRLDKFQLGDALSVVISLCFSHSYSTPPSYYNVLYDILKIMISDKSSDHRLDAQTSFLLSQICIAARTCSSPEMLSILLHIIKILLKERLASVSQFNLEEILASLALILSPRGPEFEYSTVNTDQFVLPISSIMAGILSGRRLRISGRHGLAIAVLENLLSLLFLPRLAGRRKTDMEIHPPWLRRLGKWTISKDAAIAYARLLTMLCDPSTSSVRKNRKSDDLSSATIAARKAVEPHIPGLLRKYITLDISYHLASDVRAALMPGVYAMFDVMQESTLRSLNLSLDGPGRVLFKTLYEDWSRFGKWTG